MSSSVAIPYRISTATTTAPTSWRVGGRADSSPALPHPTSLPRTHRPARHHHTGVESIAPLEAKLKGAGVEYTRSMSGRPAIFFRDPGGWCGCRGGVGQDGWADRWAGGWVPRWVGRRVGVWSVLWWRRYPMWVLLRPGAVPCRPTMPAGQLLECPAPASPSLPPQMPTAWRWLRWSHGAEPGRTSCLGPPRHCLCPPPPPLGAPACTPVACWIRMATTCPSQHTAANPTPPCLPALPTAAQPSATVQ